MKSLVFVLLLAACSAQPLENRIVGGEEALPGQFPHQVAILFLDMHNCGGTIVNNRWILTAAHCVKGFPDLFVTIVAGTNKPSDGGDEYRVAKSIYHAGWDNGSYENDIGLLMTDRDIQFGDKVKAMKLGNQEVPAGKTLTLSGWGHSLYPEQFHVFYLLFSQLNSITMDECRKALQPNKLFDTQLCTTKKTGESACKGDSGGPLVYMDQIVGIISWARKCGVGRPDVFTKVSAYLPWISENMKVKQ